MKTHSVSQPLNFQIYPFQRNSSRFQLRRITKKTHLAIRYILIIFIVAGLLSYLAFRLFLFLLSWEGLRIQQIEVKTERPWVEKEIRESLNGLYSQNILLLDLDLVEKRVLAHRWVKGAKIRKLFPSTLEITLEEHQPLAILHQANQAHLVNEEGRKLEILSAEEMTEFNLPIIYLPDQKSDLSTDDWRIISECLKALASEERASARIFFYPNPANLILRLDNDPVKLILGKDHFQEKINLGRSYRPLIEAAFGPVEYLDLRFWEDRIYFKTGEAGQSAEIIAIEEES